MNRRDALKLATAPLFVPASAFGANDRPTFGTIGTGNRGLWLHKTFQKLGAQCVAACDVYEPYLKNGLANAPAGTKGFVDYNELIATPGLDFVVVGTPDHQHWPMLQAALAAKKDVYLEKPLSMSLAQSKLMVDAVKSSKQVVQVGMQRRSMPFVRNAKKVVDDGVLGNVYMAKAMWNWNFDVPLKNTPPEGKLDWPRFEGPAPKHAFEPKRFWWWRGFWDYSGGNMTDQGTHLMDVVQWMTGNGAPLSAVCQGQIARATAGEVPDVFTVGFEYPKMTASWALDYTSAYDYDWSITLQGDKASMFMNRKGYTVYKDPGPSAQPWSAGPAAEVILEMPDKDSAEAHQQNFLDCLKSRQQPNCTVDIAAAAVAGPHMANIAWREGRKVTAAALA